MKNENIVQQALFQLNKHCKQTLKLEIDKPAFALVEKNLNNKSRFFLSSTTNNNALYQIVVEPWAAQKNIQVLIDELILMKPQVILFAGFVNPVMAEKLYRNDIFFADCAGNIYFKEPTVSIFSKNNKKVLLAQQRIRGRAFNPAGIKLIYALFNQPNLLKSAYRDIAKQVGIALGSIGPVLDDLHRSGYILDKGEPHLVNKKRLFERWVDGYLEKLRPKLLLECYQSPQPDWWKKAQPEKFEGQWGGEVTIAKIGSLMTPEIFSLYFNSMHKQAEFAEHYRLTKNPNGDICIYKNISNEQTISPMIIYADIVDSINPESWDDAKIFYAEVVAHLLVEHQ